MDSWWIVYAMVMIPVTVVVAAAIAIGIWANRADTIDDDHHTHAPAE